MEEVDLKRAVSEVEDHCRLGAEPELQHWQTGHLIPILQKSDLDSHVIRIDLKSDF